MKRFLNCTNHPLSDAQTQDLKKHWGVVEIVNLPENLKALWSQIDPEYSNLDIALKVVKPIYEFAKSQDINIAMIMGELSASYRLIQSLKRDVVIVVATSKRVSQEVTQEDGNVRKVNVFKHIMFREVC